MNFVPCLTWIKRGIAKTVPEKIELNKDELASIIEETRSQIDDLSMVDDEEEGEMNICENEEAAIVNCLDAASSVRQRKKKVVKFDLNIEEEEDFMSKYDLHSYDDDDDDVQKLSVGDLTVFSSNDDDPYVTVKDEDDSDSDDEDLTLKSRDSLIAVGHVDGNASMLEIYVYNEDEGYTYVHHDMLLSSYPLALEWLDFDPQEDTPCNLVAVGSMSPVIEVWDVDVVNCLEPSYKLGTKRKKKKKIPGTGHKDAVLTLAWNRNARNVLASGSADESVLLWDLESGKPASILSQFTDKVQSIQWHSMESQVLLTGACDRLVRLYDCRDEVSTMQWALDGEVERVLWDPYNPFGFLASTEEGNVYYLDARQDKTLWNLNAHSDSCTGISLSSDCPGCLVTVSADRSLKVWDIASGKPEFIIEKRFKLGLLHCISACPDVPFVFCMGGDNKQHNFRLWDIRECAAVRSRFSDRRTMPEGRETDAVWETELEGGEEEDLMDAAQAPPKPSITKSAAKSKWKKTDKGKKKR